MPEIGIMPENSSRPAANWAACARPRSKRVGGGAVQQQDLCSYIGTALLDLRLAICGLGLANRGWASFISNQFSNPASRSAQRLRLFIFSTPLLKLTISPSVVEFRTAKRNGDKMHDLEEKAAKLLETASKLPPGPERHELLKEIGTFRARIAVIIAKQEQLQSAK